MSLTLTTAVSLAVLGSAGAVPTAVLVGRRWIAVPLSVLSGSVLTAVAATCFVAFGATLAVWFATWSGLAALAALAWLVRGGHGHPGATRAAELAPHGTDGRRNDVPTPSRASGPSTRVFRYGAGVLVIACVALCLRVLRNPTVGFDARLIYLPHARWLLLPHGRAIAQMRGVGVLTHAGYPPLLSSTVAMSWLVTGSHSVRLAMVVVSLIVACALVVAVWALVELGTMDGPVASAAHRGPTRTGDRAPGGWSGLVGWLPPLAGLTTAILLVLVAYGVTEPFATNGYGDPLWSLAAVGTVAYGMVLPRRSGAGHSQLPVALILLAVCSEAKVEGTAVAAVLMVLLGGRAVLGGWRENRSLLGWWRPTLATVLGLAAVALWPVVVRLQHVNGDTAVGGAGRGTDLARATASYHAMVPYLHSLPLALAVAVLCGLTLWPVRRRLGVGSDLWVWASVAGGIAVVGGAYVVGPGDIHIWLAASVHRVTEFPSLLGWWIIAIWIVIAASALRGSTGPPEAARQTQLAPEVVAVTPH